MINVYVSLDDQVGYIWNADDWQKIREDFRIVGYLCGSLSNYPRQDNYFGLPMCLSANEISLLKEKMLVRLIHCPTFLQCPGNSIRKRFVEEETAFHKYQRQSYLERKEQEVKRSLCTIVEGKLKKDASVPDQCVDEMILEEVDKIQSASVGNNILYTSIADPWIEDSNFQEVDWTYPNTEQERLKYDVFKDLWENNYCLTSGAKFGGDFLCYLGDPIKFHANFIVVCKCIGADDITCTDLVVSGRIGSYTKKTFVFASRLNNSIVYNSFRWIGSIKK